MNLPEGLTLAKLRHAQRILDHTNCSTKGCPNERRPGQRNCRPCHAAASRRHRAKKKATL